MSFGCPKMYTNVSKFTSNKNKGSKLPHPSQTKQTFIIWSTILSTPIYLAKLGNFVANFFFFECS